MISMLKDWQGKAEINGKVYPNVNAFICENKPLSNQIHIILHSKAKKRQDEANTRADIHESASPEIRITVKAYMTRPTEPGSSFDFMEKWNQNKPMPLRTMTGVIDKETPGMCHMILHGQGEPVIHCMRCGRKLDNPVSRHYGIGPECMSKLGIVADISDVDLINKKLVDITWTGWVIKSAILEKEEIEV